MSTWPTRGTVGRVASKAIIWAMRSIGRIPSDSWRLIARLDCHSVVARMAPGTADSRMSQASEASTSEGYGALVAEAARRTMRRTLRGSATISLVIQPPV